MTRTVKYYNQLILYSLRVTSSAQIGDFDCVTPDLGGLLNDK